MLWLLRHFCERWGSIEPIRVRFKRGRGRGLPPFTSMLQHMQRPRGCGAHNTTATDSQKSLQCKVPSNYSFDRSSLRKKSLSFSSSHFTSSVLWPGPTIHENAFAKVLGSIVLTACPMSPDRWKRDAATDTRLHYDHRLDGHFCAGNTAVGQNLLCSTSISESSGAVIV